MPETRPVEIQDQEIMEELLQIARAEIMPQRGGKIYLSTEMRESFSDLEAELANPAACYIAGTYEGVLMGWGYAVQIEMVEDTRGGNAKKVGDVVANVKELFVQSEARDIGIGEAILSALIEWAKQSKCQGIQGTALPGNRETKGLFERFGMKTRMLTVYQDI